MQNVLFRLSETPGGITSAGAPLGAHTAEVLGRYGLGEPELAALREKGVIK
jgi:crotonobetainyl-CoA:carnitine CoA-transferase CaiB-like acyl-CoA transferase